MVEIKNSPKRVKSCAQERVGISCPTCGARHYVPQITGNQSYVTVSEQTIQIMWHRGVIFGTIKLDTLRMSVVLRCGLIEWVQL